MGPRCVSPASAILTTVAAPTLVKSPTVEYQMKNENSEYIVMFTNSSRPARQGLSHDQGVISICLGCLDGLLMVLINGPNQGVTNAPRGTKITWMEDNKNTKGWTVAIFPNNQASMVEIQGNTDNEIY